MAQKVKSIKTQSPAVLPGGKVNNFLNNLFGNLSDFKKSKKIYAVVIIIALLLLAIYKKSWFVAATVNGAPITNLELQTRLNEQFRSQTLNQLINEKIILGEAAKNNVVVSEADVNKKIAEVETSVGGAQSLDALLSQQGQTRQSIRQQLKLQLAIEKLYTNEATVSAEEVSQFIEQNKEQLRATDSAGQQKEAYDAIKSQKLSQLFSQKFQELKTKAKIQIF
ncbi:SurA N-terminal domain-containing protein [Candidatus Daviesbacteria bacterium]|nr:SurA N-terminal domain-containing protein [Candidatus Daviesbacteria bacterium]